MEGFISTEIFIKFFINSDSNQTLTQTLILTPKKTNEESADEYCHFRFILFNLKIFGEILTTFNYTGTQFGETALSTA